MRYKTLDIPDLIRAIGWTLGWLVLCLSFPLAILYGSHFPYAEFVMLLWRLTKQGTH